MREESVKSINPWQSVIQTKEGHNSSFELETKEGAVSLSFNCQLSESRMKRITQMARIKKKRRMKLMCVKSVKSINLYKSVVQTIYDIVTAKVEKSGLILKLVKELNLL